MLMVNRNGKFMVVYNLDGYQEVYEILPHGSDGYVVFGTSSAGGESRCLISLIDSMGMMYRNMLLDGPYCSSAYGNEDIYVIRMYDTLVSMKNDMNLRWKVHLDNRQTPDITDLIDGYADSYYYAVSVDGGRSIHVIDDEGVILKSMPLMDGGGSVVIEVDTCGHIHVALENGDGKVVLMELVDSGIVKKHTLDFKSMFGSERGVPIALIWKSGTVYLFADAVEKDMAKPVYIMVMEEDDALDYGEIDRWGSIGDAIVYGRGIAVGYNNPTGGFHVRFFSDDTTPVWSLDSDKGMVMDMTEGAGGCLVMAGNIPEEGNFFTAFASEDGKWITR